MANVQGQRTVGITEKPELVPLWHHAVGSQVPAYKSVPIRLQPM